MANHYIAAFVDELFQLGVREVVFSPGSRSTALALLFEEYKSFDTYIDIDERSAGFFALGIAKVKRRPVVLVCTSGSAATHYYPAIVEAKMSRVPLLVLTADRPPSLQFVGAPQTLDQTRLFGDYVNHFEHLQEPSEELYWIYPRKVAQRAYAATFYPLEAPVQINIPLQEPLIPNLNPEQFSYGRAAQPFSISRAQLSANFDQETLGQKTVILAGPDYSQDYREAVITLSERLQVPIIADPLSQFRNRQHPAIMDSYDAFLANPEAIQALEPDTILLFGQMPTSKRLANFISQHKDCHFIQVDPSLSYRNPLQSTSQLVQSHVKPFVDSITKVNKDSHYLELWQSYQDKMRQKLDLVSQECSHFEGRYVQTLQAVIGHLDCQLFVSNSMPIRDMDYWWQKQDASLEIYANRGVNGIDGIASTALGMATTGKTSFLLTGDLSFLHDLNGLIIGKTQHLNLTIILFNNDGGGIFHHLAQHDVPHFDYLFSTPHGLDFKGLSDLTGLHYHLVTDYADFAKNLEESLTQKGIRLLEIKTDKDLSLALHQKYTAYDK